MKIVLLRHGKPKVADFNRMTGIEFGAWIKSYNEAPLDELCLPPAGSMHIAKECNAAVCSTLVRSIESSKHLELTSKVDVSHDFVEAGLPNYPIFKLKFSVHFWLVLFRVMWFLGCAPNSESYSQAKERAKRCSDKLESIAKEYDSVVFVGHGILNRLISKELQKRGWQGPVKTPSAYWQFAVYEH